MKIKSSGSLLLAAILIGSGLVAAPHRARGAETGFAPPDAPAVELDSGLDPVLLHDLARAGVRDFHIRFRGFMAADPESDIERFAAWSEAVAAAGGRFFPLINVFGPPETLFDAVNIRFEGRVAANGYRSDFIPCPLDEGFLHHSLFSKLRWLSVNSERYAVRGVILDFTLNPAGEVFGDDLCFCHTCFSGFAAIHAPELDPETPTHLRKSALVRAGRLDDYYGFLEQEIVLLYTSGFLSALVDRFGLPIGVAPYRHNLFFRGVLRAANSTTHAFAVTDRRGSPNRIGAAFPRIPVLLSSSLARTEAADAICAARELGFHGALLTSAAGLWPGLDPGATPVLTDLDELARAIENPNRAADCSPAPTPGPPSVISLFSGYEDYAYRHYHAELLAGRGVPVMGVRNTNHELLLTALESADMALTAPGFNLVHTQYWDAVAHAWREFLTRGGLLAVTHAIDPAQTHWLRNIDPELVIEPAPGGGGFGGYSSSAPFVGHEPTLPALAHEDAHLQTGSDRWLPLAHDADGRLVAAYASVGNGLVVAAAARDLPGELLGELWRHMLERRRAVSARIHAHPILEPGPQALTLIETPGPGPGPRLIRQALVVYPSGVKHFFPEAELGAGNPEPAALEIEPVEAGRLLVAIKYLDPDQNRTVGLKSRMFLVEPWLRVHAERSLYTDEDSAYGIIERRGALPAERGAGRKLITAVDWTLLDADSMPVLSGRTATAGESTRFPIPIRELPPGPYSLQWRAAIPGMAPRAGTAYLVKARPAEHMTAILRRNRRFLILRDGAEATPIMAFGLPEEELAGARDMGLNSVVLGETAFEAQQRYLAAAAEAGVGVAAYPFYPQLLVLGDEIEESEKLRARIRALAQSPALMAWFLADSPDVFNQSPELICAVHRFVKSADPYHPTMIMVSDPGLYSEYADCADILMVRSFPIPGDPARVTEDIHTARISAGADKPVIAVLQAFDWAVWNHRFQEGDTFRPTAAELRNMTFQAVAAGAHGFAFWAFRASRFNIRDFPDRLEDQIELWTGLDRLGPALAGSELRAGVRVSARDGLAWTRRLTPQGRELLVLVNLGNLAVDAEVEIRGWDGPAADFETGAPVNIGDISLEPWQVLILERREPPADPEPAEKGETP